MTSATPFVSVVTPVYNGARYIGQCVESVLEQTHRAFEYIVVDNKSDDGTAEIVRSYADRDPRVQLVVPDDFVGALANANRAMRLISPKSVYTKVVHADDFLFPACLEAMTKLAEANPAVGVVGAYRQDEADITLNGLPREVAVTSGREAGRAHLLGGWGYLFGSPTSVLYRSDLVRARPEFYNTENPFQADQEACLQLLAESDFGFVHDVLTFTRRHDEAQSSYFLRVAAEAPGQLDLLLRYGRTYLSEDEYRRRLAARTFGYAAALTRHSGRVRSREYRAYHASFLRSTRHSVRIRDVVRGTRHGIARRFRR